MKKDDTQGWLPIYDIKGQCALCQNVVVEHRMAACDYGRIEFGNAQNCPVKRLDHQ